MSFVSGFIGAAYHGACRNSFNDAMSTVFLNSHQFRQMVKVSQLPIKETPQGLRVDKMFAFGAIAGATKGLVCHTFEVFDRNTVNLQKNYHAFFKLMTLGIAFFSAFKVTSIFSENFGVSSTFKHTVLMIEMVDFMHQLFFYSAKNQETFSPFTGRRVPFD